MTEQLQRVLDAARAVVDAAKPRPQVEGGLFVPAKEGMELEVALAYLQHPGEDPLIFLPKDGTDLKLVLQELEVKLIDQAMVRANECKTKAALLLNLERTTLVEKIRRLKIRKLNVSTKKTPLDRPGNDGSGCGEVRDPGSRSSGDDDKVGNIG